MTAPAAVTWDAARWTLETVPLASVATRCADWEVPCACRSDDCHRCCCAATILVYVARA